MEQGGGLCPAAARATFKVAASLAAACVVLLFAAGARAEMTGIEKLQAAQTEFRVCAAPDDLPFIDRQGKGFDNKIAALLAAAEGKKLVYTWWSAPHGLESQRLNRWDCDVEMSVPAGYGPVETTDPYYCSTYVVVAPAGRPVRRFLLAAAKEPDRVGVFVSTPPLDLLIRHHLNPRVYLPAQDTGANASQIVDDVASGRLDMAVAWGPIAGYFAAREHIPLSVTPVAAASDPSLRMTYPMSMGVRHGDRERLEQLNTLIHAHAAEIRAILRSYGVPLVTASPECAAPRDGKMSATALARDPPDPVAMTGPPADPPANADAKATADPAAKADPPAAAKKIDCTGIKTLADIAKLGGLPDTSKPYTVRNGATDASTYMGWIRFAVFCERCHGEGGVGSAIAPNLPTAVKGFNKRQFETIVTCGVMGNIGAGVMPPWGSDPNVAPYIGNLWRYLKARADGALGPGRPEKLPGSSSGASR